MNSVAHFFSSSDEDEEAQKRELIKIRRSIRDRSNPFGLPDAQLSKDAFRYLLVELQGRIKNSVRSSSVPLILKLAATLRMFAEGGYQHGTGKDFELCLAQSTVSTVFKEVVNALESTVCRTWVSVDMTEEEKSEAKLWFFRKFLFPGVIGCIDGTHIKIIAPKKNEQHLYYNRKGFYSLNAMIICDHNMKIRCFDATHPGSSHDALIWNSSELKHFLKSKFDGGDRNSWLLGDAGYPLESFLMTPFRNAAEGTPQGLYNGAHTKARNIIERTIGVLKNRFRCLLSARQLHYSPQKAIQIANVCAALHNICIHFRVPTLPTEEIENELETELYDGPESALAVNVRNRVMNSILDAQNV